MTKRRIIGLLGPRGSGKDTAADYIREVLPMTISAAFADPIRYMLAEFLGIDPDDMRAQQWKDAFIPELGCTGREALNRFGEGMKALFGPGIWIDWWLRDQVDWGHNVVVPDVRTEFEIKAVLDLGGELWHVTRKGVSYTGETYDTHPSVRLEDKYLLNYGGTMRFKDNIRSLLYPGGPNPSYGMSGVGPMGKATLVDAPDTLVDYAKEQAKADMHNHGYQLLEGEGHD